MTVQGASDRQQEPACSGGRARPSLIAVGAMLPGSGFTRVLQTLLGRLSRWYEVHYVGIGYRGPRRVEHQVTLHPSNLHGGDLFGAYQCAEMVQALDAPLVLLLNDLWMLRSYPRALRPLGDRVRTVAYVPIDGTVPDDALLEPISTIDHFVAYTEFGRREIGRALASVAARGREVADRNVSVIPHGVDTTTFRPLAGALQAQLLPGARLAVRRRLWPDEPDWHDAFVVLNANRPMPRKRIDLTLDGFAAFAQGKPPSVKLWLHHAIMSPDERATLTAQIERLGIAGRVRLTPPGSAPLSDADLNLTYNACDVGVNTSMGEGWGLVSFEHAATGAAQVVPSHSACSELWDGAAELVETQDVGVPPSSLLGMRTVTAEGVAAALDRLYADPERLRRRSRAAFQNALDPAYAWDRIAEQWHTRFERLLHDLPARRTRYA
ncbi:MAG: glycosyltransferase [Chloroflexota bacterium]